MNILLTGGAGYIGSHTVVVLSNLGHHVVVYDNFCNSRVDVLDRVQQITADSVLVVKGDVRDTPLLQAVMQKHRVDMVVHLGAVKAVGESVLNPIDYYANNVQGTISLLQAMSSRGVKRLVFSSSAAVYGEPQYLPIDEKHPTCPQSPYGRSKLHSENILSDVAASDTGWGIVCLRYFNPVGAHESGSIGEDPMGVPSNLMPYICQVAVGRRKELQIFGGDYPTPDGTGVRDYIHVVDLARGHVAALDWLMRHNGIHTFNLGTGSGKSVLEVVRAFEVVSGRAVPVRMMKRRRGDVAQCYADSGKANKKLGWSSIYNLDEMCRDAWNWQFKNLAG